MADNRRIAALAAALAYIEAQRGETAALAASQAGVPERFALGGGTIPSGATTPSPWALYGRQRIMNMRALMQSRGFSRRV